MAQAKKKIVDMRKNPKAKTTISLCFKPMETEVANYWKLSINNLITM